MVLNGKQKSQFNTPQTFLSRNMEVVFLFIKTLNQKMKTLTIFQIYIT